MIISKFTEDSGGEIALALRAKIKSTVKEHVINNFFNANGIRAILVHGAKGIVNHGFALVGLFCVQKRCKSFKLSQQSVNYRQAAHIRWVQLSHFSFYYLSAGMICKVVM